MVLGDEKEPPQKVTALRLISPGWTAAMEVEASEAYGEALVRHLYAVGAGYLAEAVLVYLTFAVSLLSISSILGYRM